MPAKLSLHVIPVPARLAALQRKLAGWAGAKPAVSVRTCLFFDTPSHYLRAHGLSLYLERDAGRWIQHLQRLDGQGLEIGPIWRAPYAGGFDFSLVEDDALARTLGKDKCSNKLRLAFELRLRCSAFDLSVARASAERAQITAQLERGLIVVGDLKAAVSCLHLACASDERAPLFDVAEELCRVALLAPQMMSLRDQGYELINGVLGQPARAKTLNLGRDATTLDAFRCITLACLQHALGNRQGAIERPDDPEFVHQLRVAIRRLRAAMQIFRPVLPDDYLEAALPPLRELMATLGRTRDLDVLIHDIVKPVGIALPDEPRLRDLIARLDMRLHEARDATGRALQRADLAQELLRLRLRTENLCSENDAAETLGASPVREFAERRMKKRLRAAQRCALAARTNDPVSLHELRIAIKRLRYGLEFFSSLLPEGTARSLLKRLATLQEELGQLNDLASAGTLLMANAGDDPRLREAVTLIGGWHGKHYATLLADIPRHLKRVTALRLPRLSKLPAKPKKVAPAETMLDAPHGQDAHAKTPVEPQSASGGAAPCSNETANT